MGRKKEAQMFVLLFLVVSLVMTNLVKAGWTSTEVVSTESTSISVRPSLGVDSDGTVHIAWDDFTNYGGAGGGGTDSDIFYSRFGCNHNYFRIIVENHDFEPSLTIGAQDPTTLETLWTFEAQFQAQLIGPEKIEYIIPFKTTETLPSDQEIILFAQAIGSSGTITEFSVICLDKTYTSLDPPVDIGFFEPAIASVDFTTPPQVLTSTGTGNAAISSSSGKIESFSAIDESTLPVAGRPTDVSFPDGLFSFTITDISPGETVTVSLEFPSSVSLGSQYWKCHIGATLEWFSMPIGCDDADNIITFSVTDGGLGDADGVANGEIVDPGGIGIFVASSECAWDLLLLAVVLCVIIIVTVIFVYRRKG